MCNCLSISVLIHLIAHFHLVQKLLGKNLKAPPDNGPDSQLSQERFHGCMSGNQGVERLSIKILANANKISSLGWGKYALKKGLNLCEDSSEG